MPDWPRFVEIVREHRRFVLTTHVRPDGDAMGSQLAMGAVLRHLGKDVRMVNAFATPPDLEFLDPDRQCKELGVDVAVEDLDDCEVLMVLDTTAWAQLGEMGRVIRTTKARKLVLDHHVSEDDLGAELFKDQQAEATGRLVIDAADQLGVPITPEIARAAFVALATDTGWFRFSSTNAETLRLAARLANAGAQPAVLYAKLYEEETLSRLHLLGRTMARARTELAGRLIHTCIEQADFAATGAHPSDSEDLINLTLSVRGTEVAVLFAEQPDGRCKVSFRSRCELDCNRVASGFGGGGHRKAAGAMLDGPLAAVRQQVLDAVRAAMG